jgi:two-component system cell cycle sensor histidine kinase/response regulator CckA
MAMVPNGSEKMDNRFFEHSPDPLCILEFDGRLKQPNPSFVSAFGWTEEELMNEPFLTLVHPDDRKATAMALSGLIESDSPGQFELRLRCKDGSLKWTSFSARSVRTESSIYATLRDITKVKEAEAALKESERKYRHLLEVATEGIMVIDAGMNITYVNDRFLNILGYQAEEVVGKQLAAFADSPDIPRLLMHIGRRKRGVEEEYDIGLIHRDGQKVLTNINASPMYDDDRRYCGSISIVTDVTEKRRMENALKEEKERLNVTLRSIGDGVIVTDNDGSIFLMNYMAEELTGWKQKEAVSRPLEDVFNIVNEVTRERCENPVEKVLKLGRVVGLANHTLLLSKDGTERMLGDSGAPIRDENGSILGVVLVFRDVTNERKMEDEIARMQRLESIGILAGGIAHDFNNYLTAIEGNISLARMKLNSSVSAASERLADAEKASIKARGLTKQLLVFSKGGEPVKKIIDVGEALSDSLKITLAGSKVQSKLDIELGLCPIEADEGQIGQALNNIILNARDSMPDGGVIEIRAENATLQENEVQSCRPGEYIRISIQDHGVGIPAKNIDRIFDPYFTTKQDGRGLGLSIVHSIIKHHDGCISVRSEVGEGTTFAVLLPVPFSYAEPKEETSKDLVSGKGRILWMDDEEMIREVGGEFLSILGYEVEFTRHGEEAIEKFLRSKNAGQHFDLVILDLTVPGHMGGEETVRRLLEIDPEVKAMICSGYSNNPLMSRYYDYGFSGVIPKPFGMEELSAAVSEAIGR